MKNYKPHFRYNKRQRNGVLSLLFLIVVIQGAYFYISNNSEFQIQDTSEFEKLYNQLDSLKRIQKKILKPYKFNPNYISDEKGYLIGMSVQEIDRLLAYRASGKWIENAIDFQKVTKVSDSLLKLLTPFFQFPQKIHDTEFQSYSKKKIIKKDINTASANELKTIYGVGDKLSARIIKYRNKLNGFTFMSQLDEVWGLSDEIVKKIKKKYRITKKPVIEKINLNDASFKEVLSIVYVDYETTKLILNYRDSVGKVENLIEIKKIHGFPIDKYDRIALYLRAE